MERTISFTSDGLALRGILHMPEGAGTAGPRFNMPDGAISQQDAAAIQDYYRALAASNRCPAGTIPAGAGCMQAVPPNRWVVGQPMSHAFWPEPLPRELAARLNPSQGFHYVRVGASTSRARSSNAVTSSSRNCGNR